MDVPTRWNSTFTMLDGAIKCQKTFERLEEHDSSYLPKDDIPTAEDWDNAKVLVKFLKTFSEGEIPSISSNGSYKARGAVHDRFKQSNKTCLDDAKIEIISQVARDIYSIPISTVSSESTFSTGGRVLDSFRSSSTPQTVEALICAQNWI
ncbi:zinc finger BED domain-containing protein RICESLEEPER 2-like [Cucumis melo var. makuwa]|uniref:Zinc finger BED domain-containing protein RICESLEEPER 2-like n=1 Tax=Cucumis melo var. makuwa TaxID=1194695 RepID=A0A5D3DXI2_CUCMM|nr:zinc finger BED domain-containing protein RICESLEEPER 2-like [Cucumis melo var. makuwa]TYK28035.1 zinc finger BED domain-containing protein RICESLEEPER 2-like [Cucumis melo var. makuwa]